MAPTLKKILCIDDEEDILQVAKLALESVGGFDIEICSSGSEGVTRARETNPQLILLDAMMPQMDGPATLVALRQDAKLGSIPVIFMTARVQPAQIEEYKALGAAGVITKPFDPMKLSQEVQELWLKCQNS